MAASAARKLKTDIMLAAAPDLQAAIRDWQDWLRDEKRASPHTCLAYGRDLTDFLSFLTQHRGQPPTLADLSALATTEFRAWLAARTSDSSPAW